MSSTVLADKDINAGTVQVPTSSKADMKTMEYHRQVLQSKLDEEQVKQQYVSPSDNIMSPCTAKLSAYRSKHAIKAKPKSLFAQASAKKLGASVETTDTPAVEKELDGQKLL